MAETRHTHYCIVAFGTVIGTTWRILWGRFEIGSH